MCLFLAACSSDDEKTVKVTEVGGDGSPAETTAVVKLPFVGGPVIFTEVDPINTVYEDHEGDDAGWVELFNTSTDSVNLEGMTLTNSLDEPTKWTFGHAVIAPASFMLVYLSGKNLPDFVAPHDSVSMIGPGCWSWTDAQNEDVAGESYSEPLDGQSKICFTENGSRMFGARMRLGENQELGWSSISTFIGTGNSSSTDSRDISADNELLFHAFITKDRKVSFRLGQTGIDDWKGYEMVFTGTGDSSTVYKARLPQGTTFPDLSVIYGTRMSPESQEKKEVSVKVFSYIARNRGHEPHAGFKIKNEPGSLYLLNANSEILDSVAYPEMPVGHTWSIGNAAADPANVVSENASANSAMESTAKENSATESAALAWGFAEPSPYGFTATAVVGEQAPALDTVTALPPSGFYQTAFVLSFPAEDYVRCEKGGLSPTEASPLVTELLVDSTMALRCASYVPGKLPGEVSDRTYVFETLPQVPVVFLTADPNSLFDPDTGIYMEGPYAESSEPHYGANYWEDKEIPVFVELLETGANQPAFAKNAGLKIFGNYSRQNAKKSVAITFREKYGDNRLKYQLFPDFPELTKFKVFILRNNGSNFGQDYIRDRVSSSISEGLGIDYQRGRGAIVYYNGEYYGIHNIRERSTEYYFETHYGYDPESIDLLKADNSASAGSSVDYVNLMTWMESNDMSLDENYAYVAEQIDVDNFMNYMQLEMFVNNRDWPGNNLKKWRSSNPVTKWKWFIYDTDFGFGTRFSNYTNNIFEFATTEEGESWPNGPEYTFLLRKLLENQSFRTAFINRMSVLLSMNFESSRTLARIDAIMAEIEPEIARDQARWNLKASSMESNLDDMKTFAKERPSVILSELQEFFSLGTVTPVALNVTGGGTLLVNGLRLDSAMLTISFFAGTPVTVTAVSESGGIWAGWSDGVMDMERTVLPEEVSSLTAIFK